MRRHVFTVALLCVALVLAGCQQSVKDLGSAKALRDKWADFATECDLTSEPVADTTTYKPFTGWTFTFAEGFSMWWMVDGTDTVYGLNVEMSRSVAKEYGDKADAVIDFLMRSIGPELTDKQYHSIMTKLYLERPGGSSNGIYFAGAGDPEQTRITYANGITYEVHAQYYGDTTTWFRMRTTR